MSLRRIWLDERPASETFTVQGEAFHHAFRVSKFRVGEQFEIVCGGPAALHVQVKSIGKNLAELTLIGTRTLPLPRQPYIGLAVCMPKWPTWDWIVEKAVELGVSSIQPLISEHSVLRSPSDFTPSKKDRTVKIIKSALEQSG